ncbi:hypothetical protein FKM82_011436 [Ascaphus truei]
MFCNGTFDDFACWPDGVPGTYVNVTCPWYLPWANTVAEGSAFRFCTPEGTWLLKENSTDQWKNLSECESPIKEQPEGTLSSISIVYTIGHSLSLSALIIATIILVRFRHLHCTRNYIHLNLFTSFILRAVSVFIKDSAIKWMYSKETFHTQRDGVPTFQEPVSCRLVLVMMHYCVAANYYWLLVEGIYLHTLLVLSACSEQRLFRLYLCIGWGGTGSSFDWTGCGEHNGNLNVLRHTGQ